MWRALLKAVVNLRVRKSWVKFLDIREPLSFSGGTLLEGVNYLRYGLEERTIVQFQVGAEISIFTISS
jgi:hypothetical protein